MSSEALGNLSAEIVQILVLFMTTAGDGASGSCCLLFSFSNFEKQNGGFWCRCFGLLKTKQLIEVSKIFIDPYVSSTALQDRKTIPVSSNLCVQVVCRRF